MHFYKNPGIRVLNYLKCLLNRFGYFCKLILKPSNKSAIKFNNPEILREDDRGVVEGVNRSISEGTILDDVSNIDYKKAPSDLMGAVTNPMMNIKTKDQLGRYEEFVREQIYNNLKRPQVK